MKLGKETGSLINHLMSGQPAREPMIGEGATILAWTDRYACTVIAWDAKAGVLTVQRDHAKRADANGMSEDQDYTYEANRDAEPRYFKMDKQDRWYEVTKNPRTQRWNKSGGRGLLLGVRREYYDFSF